jgi:hypothetical protein
LWLSVGLRRLLPQLCRAGFFRVDSVFGMHEGSFGICTAVPVCACPGMAAVTRPAAFGTAGPPL